MKKMLKIVKIIDKVILWSTEIETFVSKTKHTSNKHLNVKKDIQSIQRYLFPEVISFGEGPDELLLVGITLLRYPHTPVRYDVECIS